MKRILSLLFRTLIIFSLSISVYGAWTFLKNPTEFPIRSVKVTSRFQQVHEAELKKIMMPYVVQGFFNVEKSALQQQLEAIPWIAAVTIKRVWPDGLVIQLTEQQAIAKWGNDKLINAQGKIFAPRADTIPKHLPILIGSDEQQEWLWQYYQQFNHMLQPLGLSISLLEMNARGALHVVTNNGIEVKLGNSEILRRFQRLIAVYPKLEDAELGHIEYIDLRYKNGFAAK